MSHAEHPKDLLAIGVEEGNNWRNTTPTVSLRKLLVAAQENHRTCVTKALTDGIDPVEKCSLTWYEVHNRWMQWAAFRAPFETAQEKQEFNEYWTPARVEKFEKSA